ncbi:MAG TPA: hypothetical protein V6D14_00105 [Coleofasciculaceae cyanobacterium]
MHKICLRYKTLQLRTSEGWKSRVLCWQTTTAVSHKRKLMTNKSVDKIKRQVGSVYDSLWKTT